MKRTRIVIFTTGILGAAVIGGIVATHQQSDTRLEGDRPSVSSTEPDRAALDRAPEPPLPSSSASSPEPLPLSSDDAALAERQDYEEPSPMPPVTNQPLTPVQDLFEPALSDMRSRTQVPLLMPDALPTALMDDPIYIAHAEDAGFYSLTLGLTPDCSANACSVGSIEGQAGGEAYLGEFSETVQLAQGVQGYFQPMTCAASCSPPVIGWSDGDAFYRIYLKAPGSDAEVRDALIAVANSAIARGAR